MAIYIVKYLRNQLEHNTKFSDLASTFLNSYSAYDPKVGKDWETYIKNGCEILFSDTGRYWQILCQVIQMA